MDIIFHEGDIIISFDNETISFEIGCLSTSDISKFETAIDTGDSCTYIHNYHSNTMIMIMDYNPFIEKISLRKDNPSIGISVNVQVSSKKIMKVLKDAIVLDNKVLCLDYKICKESHKTTFVVKMIDGSVLLFDIPATSIRQLYQFCSRTLGTDTGCISFTCANYIIGTINIKKLFGEPRLMFESIKKDGDMTKSLSVYIPIDKCYKCFFECSSEIALIIGLPQ